ncbi:histone deacetylase [Streptomonospora sp. S1-112]|uniref:Histone deacetylase n=2 Tax=Streptomonospora mangrovi TaxID=2883123 RepID=A0A9X3NGV5_9ACTN|nr:histone deacetylase [Streptomonospora mangrovi]MDA0563479.1 histone deacetylase [Streptomonospora mangrovi]
MSRDRFDCYLAGGVPPGGSRANPGCSDTRPPRDVRRVWLPGGIYFALASPMWGGGLAMLDPGLPGAAPARAYLVTAGQFADIAAQEMYRDPGDPPDLRALAPGERLRLGPGRYETLLRLGDIEGRPAFTFTAHWSQADVAPAAPAAAYLAVIGAGLLAAHGWSPARAGAYLAGRPGAAEAWAGARVAALLGAR